MEKSIQELKQIHEQAEAEVKAAEAELSAWMTAEKITEAEAETMGEHIERLSYWLSTFTEPARQAAYDAKWPRPS